MLHDMFFSASGLLDSIRLKKYTTRKMCYRDGPRGTAPTVVDADAAVKARQFSERHGIKNFFDAGEAGVVHQALAEKGFALPGNLILCGDSHTVASGAFNCAARGMGPLDMVYVFCLGETWQQVGRLFYLISAVLCPRWSAARTSFLYMAGKYGDVTNKNVEFAGPALPVCP